MEIINIHAPLIKIRARHTVTHGSLMISRVTINTGGHGGLEVKAKIAEQRQWGGQGSVPRQWEKKRHPLTNNTA